MNLRDLIGDAPDWTGALCAQSDPNLFHPDQGGTTHRARAICRRCPLVEPCLDYIMRTEDPAARFGVWGNTSAAMRDQLAHRGAVA